MQIKKLHHHAVRCRNSEDTRKFYEDFLGMPLVHAIKIDETKTGRKTQTLHTFFRLGDGSHLAFLRPLTDHLTLKNNTTLICTPHWK